MNVYIRRAEHVKKRRHTNFHSGSSVDIKEFKKTSFGRNSAQWEEGGKKRVCEVGQFLTDVSLISSTSAVLSLVAFTCFPKSS